MFTLPVVYNFSLVYFQGSLRCSWPVSYNFSPFSHEAMIDLVHLLHNLVDNKGKILVPGVYDSVAELTAEEAKLYDAIDFDTVSFLTHSHLEFLWKVSSATVIHLNTTWE